jgi:hypothetical protein
MYITMLSVAQMNRENNALERMWKEAAVAQFKVRPLSRYFPEGGEEEFYEAGVPPTDRSVK